MFKSLKRKINYETSSNGFVDLTETSSSLLGFLEQFKILAASSIDMIPLILEEELDSLAIFEEFLATSKKLRIRDC